MAQGRTTLADQDDEDDAQAVINYIRADRQLDVDIKPCADAPTD
ncbi:hypothetical protein [Salinicola corii]|nr:hypothetical protein [Salinicola corii]